MYRLINYLFGFTVIYLFILEAGMYDHARILTALVLSFIVGFVAFFGNWITLDAIKAVVILGTIILGFAGWLAATAIVFFFISGSLLTRRNLKSGIVDDDKLEMDHHLQKRRDGYQIWANGFWIALFSIGYFLFSTNAFLIAVFVSIAAATADTWATEIGTYKPWKTVNITTFKATEPGSDGGVSLKGTFAAISGAFAISIFILPGDFIFTSTVFLIVFVFGFTGSVIDSILGAILSDKNVSLSVPDDFSGTKAAYLNSFVNWISIGVSGLLALFTTQLMI